MHRRPKLQLHRVLHNRGISLFTIAITTVTLPTRRACNIYLSRFFPYVILPERVCMEFMESIATLIQSTPELRLALNLNTNVASWPFSYYTAQASLLIHLDTGR